MLVQSIDGLRAQSNQLELRIAGGIDDLARWKREHVDDQIDLAVFHHCEAIVVGDVIEPSAPALDVFHAEAVGAEDCLASDRHQRAFGVERDPDRHLALADLVDAGDARGGGGKDLHGRFRIDHRDCADVLQRLGEGLNPGFSLARKLRVRDTELHLTLRHEEQVTGLATGFVGERNAGVLFSERLADGRANRAPGAAYRPAREGDFGGSAAAWIAIPAMVVAAPASSRRRKILEWWGIAVSS